MASVLAAFAVLAPAAFAGPRTYYASPTGSGTTCASATPCALTKAVEEAVNEDSVILEPGTYTLAVELAVTKAIELGGQPGAAPPVIATNGHALRVNQGADARFHDLRIEGTAPFQLFSGTGERIFVSFTGTGSEACGMTDGATLVNSVCWAHDGGPTASSSAIGMSIAGQSTTLTLRNDTAIDSDPSGNALHARTTGTGPKLVVEATNVIARAEHHPDVELDNTGSGFPVTEVKLTHSNYATVDGEAAPLATITAPGTNGNQTAAPTFVAAAEGDFREVAGSPTIDAGLTEAGNGPLAVGGEERTLAACLGGPAVTDIGAYERADRALRRDLDPAVDLADDDELDPATATAGDLKSDHPRQAEAQQEGGHCDAHRQDPRRRHPHPRRQGVEEGGPLRQGSDDPERPDQAHRQDEAVTGQDRQGKAGPDLDVRADRRHRQAHQQDGHAAREVVLAGPGDEDRVDGLDQGLAGGRRVLEVAADHRSVAQQDHRAGGLLGIGDAGPGEEIDHGRAEP